MSSAADTDKYPERIDTRAPKRQGGLVDVCPLTAELKKAPTISPYGRAAKAVTNARV